MKNVFTIKEYLYNKLLDSEKELIGEIMIPYEGQLKAFDMITKYRDKVRIVFDVSAEMVYTNEVENLAREFNELTEIYNNIAFRMNVPTPTLSKSCPNMFYTYHFAAKTYIEAIGLLNTGIRETYVTGSLAADINQLKKLRKHLKIRMIPNIVQTDAFLFGNPNLVDPLACFWVRPEAIKIYDEVVNTIEIIDLRLEVFKAYFERKWTGPIGAIILDYTNTLVELENDYRPIYDKYKSECGLHCQKEASCHACQTMKFDIKIRHTEKENLSAGES